MTGNVDLTRTLARHGHRVTHQPLAYSRNIGVVHRNLLAFHHLDAAVGLLMITSTRRFCSRPAAEPLSATGSLLPLPNAESRIELIPCPARYDFTESARRSDSPWLYS